MRFSKRELTSIINILTLRFNPEEKPFFPKKSWHDFVEKNSDPCGRITELLLDQSLTENLSKYDTICIGNSGGIDSSLLFALIKKNFPNKKLFSITLNFNGTNSEFAKAKKVAEKYNATPLEVKCTSILENMDFLVSLVNEPRWNTYVSFVAQKAKDYGDILVTGDGADELFAGYDFRYFKFLQLKKLNSVRKYLMCHERDWVVDQQQMFDDQVNFNWEKIFSYFNGFFKNNLSTLKQVILADFNGKLLHDILPTNNRVEKFLGMKIFSPFVSSDLVKHVTHLPMNELYDGKEGKIVLKQILNRHNLSVNQRKIGFGPNLVADWMNYFEKPRTILLDSNCHIYKTRLINFEWVKKSLNKSSDFRYASKLTSIYALEKWLKKSMD